jgi:hypothetical protein
MGKKYDGLKGKYTWMPVKYYRTRLEFYIELCRDEESKKEYCPEYVLVKLSNGYISRGTLDGTGLWWVYDYDNKMRVVSLENPVIEWCWLPMERE